MSLRHYSLSCIAIILMYAAGCSSPRPVSDQPASGAAFTAERTVSPFTVYAANGTPIEQPFLGGFNTPRPQFVDINGDGDPDLFVQERSNELMFFEHVADTSAPLQWRTDRYRDLEIGEWFRFVDMDQDGDYDLLAEQPYSYIRYYRNDGTPRDPDFVLAADSLRDASGDPLFSDRQNIPNVTDIDCDGRLDLFIGRLDGTVTRYESTGLDDRGIPRFELVSKQFEGISIVKQFGTLHGANTLAFYDIDNDQDMDLFWGDFFEPGLLLIENEGSCSNPQLQGEPTPFPPSNPLESSGYNAPAFTDWGGDGDVDLLVGVLGGAYNASNTLAENLYFYEQGEGGAFTLLSKRFLHNVDIGNESMPAAGDLDGDGDIDLLLANKIDPGNQNRSVVYRYENRTEPADEAPALHQTGVLDLPEAYHYAPVLGDLNGDGRDDLLLGTWKGRIAYYRNTGQGFAEADPALVKLDRVSNSAPALGDLDGDGDLDLLVGEAGGGVFFLRNKGDAASPAFSLEENALPGVEAAHRSAPALHDVDDDGDLDLLLGTQNEGLLFYRNIGSPSRPSFRKERLPGTLRAPDLAAPRFADFEGDGQADLLLGGAGGGLIYYRR